MKRNICAGFEVSTFVVSGFHNTKEDFRLSSVTKVLVERRRRENFSVGSTSRQKVSKSIQGCSTGVALV